MSTPAPDALAEGDLVEAIFPGGSWRPAKVKEIGDTYIAICFTGNSTRHELPPNKVRPRPGARPKSKPEPAAEVIDLTIDVDEGEKIEAHVLHDVDSLANAVEVNFAIASRPSFSHAFGGNGFVPPRSPTKSDDEPQPPPPVDQHRDPYAEHPIVQPPPGSILGDPYAGDYVHRSRGTDEYPLARGRSSYLDARNPGFHLGGSHFEEQYDNFSGRKERRYSDINERRNTFSHSYDDRGPPGRKSLYTNPRDERGYVSNDVEEEGYEAEEDDEIELPPSPTERVRLEQEHIGIHPDLSSMRIPRVNDRRGGTRVRLPFDEDDAISNRHPNTWRQSHMTVAGFSPAEKSARREAAKKRTSPRSALKRPPPSSSRSETVSEVSDDDTLTSSDEAVLENLPLLEMQKRNKRPVDLPPSATSKRPKVHHLSTMKGDVVASGVRPPSLRTNKGKIIAGRKKPRPQAQSEVIDLVSGSTSRRVEGSKPKRRAMPSTPILPAIPPVVPRRGTGRRKSQPRRDAGLPAISLAREIDKCVEKDFRAYDEMLKNCSFSSSIFDDYKVTQHSPSSARFFSCTCDPKSEVDKPGKILRCTLCARYSHLWCTGLGRNDLDQLNVDALTSRAQFVCMQCTETVADGKPPSGKPFPISTDLNKRLIVPPLVFPLFDFLLSRSIPSARLLLNLRNNPRPKQQYWQLSEEDKRMMWQNVELLRAGVLPRSVHQNSVTKLLSLK